MKPAPFRILTPSCLEEVLEVLADHGERAAVVAGGQSLAPRLNLRSTRPDVLVDIRRVAPLHDLRATGGSLEFGAMVTQRQLELSPFTRSLGMQVISEALRHVGSVPIRNRGTVVGSLAQADMTAELPVVLAALDAELTVRGSETRSASPLDFYRPPGDGGLRADELVTECRVVGLPPGHVCGFNEFSMRHSDPAIVLGVVRLARTSVSEAEACRVIVGGASAAPQASRPGLALSLESDWDELHDFGRHVADELDVTASAAHSVDYLREVAGVVVARAARAALDGFAEESSRNSENGTGR